MIDRRAQTLALAGTLLGLLVLLVGLWRAAIIFGYSDEDREALRQGRLIVIGATVVLTAAGVLLVASGRPLRGTLILLPGAVCTGAVLARDLGQPGSVLFYYPIPAALALAAAIPRRRRA